MYHEDHEKKALNALAEDMASIPSHVVPPCSSEHRDAALGLPLEEPERFDESTGPMDTTPDLGRAMVDAVLEHAKHAGMRSDLYLPHNGMTPGPTPSRTDAASLSNVIDAKHKAAIAYARLLRSLTTQEQKDAACDYMACELEVMDLLEGGAK